MKIILKNNIIVDNPTPSILKFAVNELVVTNPTYSTLKRLGKEDTIRFKHIPEKMCLYSANGLKLLLPFGVLNSIWPMIKDSNYELDFNDHGETEFKHMVSSQNLFDYQKEAVDAMMKNKGGVLVGGCGSGKTQCGIEIAHRIGKKFLWLTHTKDLLKQSYNRFKSLYPNIKLGTITEGKIDMGEDGTIATIQTMANLDPYMYKDDFDVVITDECHHVSGSPTLMKYFSKVINSIPARYKFGLTATPSRGDTMIKSMYAYIGCNDQGEFEPQFIIDRSKIKTLNAKHVMIPLDTEMSYEALNLDGTFDYAKLIDYLSENEQRNDIIINNVVEHNKEGRKQLILCSRVSHCEFLHNKLLKLGIKSELLVGKVSAKKRESILNDKGNSWEVIVATYSLAKEGLDLPILDTLHMTTPQKDKALVVQSVGRIERVMENKKEPLALDYVDVNIPYCLGSYKKRKNQIKNRY